MSSSDEEDEKESGDQRRRIDRLFSSYENPESRNSMKSKKINNKNDDGGENAEFVEKLRQEFLRQSYCCLICIERISRNSPIWNCTFCRTSYHLQCIRPWAVENVTKCELEENEENSNNFNRRGERSTAAKWCCPKCRFEFGAKQLPNDYRCFCEKVLNPKPDPWLLPHSCGALCKRSFACGHWCVLLCHPGPCPPCPKIVDSTCFCEKSPPRVSRCCQSKWSCGKTCGKILSCGLHRCGATCHKGECQPCEEKFERNCACGRSKELRRCGEKVWSCGAKCEKILSCGRHRCEKSCHVGRCEPCGTDGACPCGKVLYEKGDCIDDFRCCGDTCGKLLNCGVHNCTERCHRGPCGVCNQPRPKRCRCGLKTKDYICGKELLCEVKCKMKRQCGRHACNRKCCNGDCPPCELTCGLALKCGNHKCVQPCHRGPCFPCSAVTEVKCRCGKSVIKVPCGQERRTKPPRCREMCSVPPVCKHKNRTPHKCHFGDCPPCGQICGQSLSCGHFCPSRCHCGLLVDVNKADIQKPATPWEKVQPKWELIDTPCPPCPHPTPVVCLGGHSTENFPCSEVRPYSCGKKCGRPLPCGNHFCSILCHSPTEECEICEAGCSLPRPKDCPHRCPLLCHPTPCPKCRLMVKFLCHCKLNERLVPCVDWSAADDAKRTEYLSCGNQCPKLMACGHVCTKTCHVDGCSNPSDCPKRIQARCPCGRKVMKTQCGKLRNGEIEVLCDSECENEKILNEEKKKRMENELSAASAVDPTPEDSLYLQQQSLVRRRRKKKTHLDVDTEKPSPFWKSRWFALILIVFFVFILLIYVIRLTE